MTENEITFSHEITFYALQVECSVMLTIACEVGLFIHLWSTVPAYHLLSYHCCFSADVFQELKLTSLESKMIETECAMTELETTASQQLHGLAKQSEHALETLQKKLLLTNDKIEEFMTFVKVCVLISFWVFT